MDWKASAMSKWNPVLNKTDFAIRYKAGEFGNASPTWATIEEFRKKFDSVPNGLYHLRNRIRGGATYYDLNRDDVWRVINQLEEIGHDMTTFYVSAMAPTSKTILQGEVIQSEKGGLYLFYSCLPLTMREGLAADGRNVSGVTARYLIEKYLCPNSQEWLQILLNRYTNHVVEFSAYSVEWGTVSGYNTVFWEVRNY